MAKGRRKKDRSSQIPTKLTTSLTSEMRSELGTEEFENSQSSPSTPKSTSMHSTQRSSNEKSAENTEKSNKQGDTRVVKILAKEAPIEYQNSCISIFDVTIGTESLNSVMSPNSEMKKKINEQPPTKAEAAEEMYTMVEHFTTANAGHNLGVTQRLNDFTFMDGIRNEARLFPTAEKHRLYMFAQEEHNIINTMIADVNKMLQDAGRKNIVINYKIEKGNNGIPSLSISLIPSYPKVDDDYIRRRNKVDLVKYSLEERLYRQQHNPVVQAIPANPNSLWTALSAVNNFLGFARWIT